MADGTEDDEYLAAWRTGVICALDLAGADPFVGDRLGRLNISKVGLVARDRFVFEICHTRGIPTGVVMAGGYASTIQDIVDIHYQTVKIAVELAERDKTPR